MKKLRLGFSIVAIGLLTWLTPMTAKADSASYNAVSNTVDGYFSGGVTGIWQLNFNTGQVYTSTDNLNGETGFSIAVPSGATSATVLMQQIESGEQSSYQINIAQPAAPTPTPQEESTPQKEPTTQEEPASPAPAQNGQQSTPDDSKQSNNTNQGELGTSQEEQDILANEKKKEEEARQNDRAISVLAGLTVAGTELSPTFDPAVTEYTAMVEASDRVTVTAVKAVEGQTVSGDGEITIDKKDKDIEITVSSADGVQTTKYILHIRVKKEEKSQSQTEKKEKTESKSKKRQVPVSASPNTQSKPKQEAAQPKKSALLIIGFAIGAVVLIGVGIGGYFFLIKKGIIES